MNDLETCGEKLAFAKGKESMRNELLAEFGRNLGCTPEGVPGEIDGILARLAEVEAGRATAIRESGTIRLWLEEAVAERDGLRDLVGMLRDRRSHAEGRAARAEQDVKCWRGWADLLYNDEDDVPADDNVRRARVDRCAQGHYDRAADAAAQFIREHAEDQDYMSSFTALDGTVVTEVDVNKLAEGLLAGVHRSGSLESADST